MHPQRWRQVAELFEQLTELPVEQRTAFIERAAANDAKLRDELESLRRAHEVALSPLDAVPKALIEGLPPQWPPGWVQGVAREPTEEAAAEAALHVGPYRLLRPIGEGGMGSVWLAERADGALKRTVALKRPHVSWVGALAERMVQERDILAALEHPHIARLYDAGVTGDGRPYLALEYIEGLRITDYCDRHRLSVRQRLQLFLQVLDAVRYAHAHLVIHRDIKPSNILVSADGKAHLLDFGVAKLVKQETPGSSTTHFGPRMMTPNYASPEHIAGLSVSTASDIYSLGVLLAELLSGSRPYQLKRDSQGALEAAILETEPVPPSRNLKPGAASARSTSRSALARALRGDLDKIVGKALMKAPEDRYATADLFAQDIARHLNGEAILAQRGSAWYYAGKFLRRHKLAVGSAATVMLAIVVGFVIAVWQYHRAENEAQTSRAVEEFLKDVFLANSRSQPDPVKARQTTARELLAQGVSKIDSAMANAPAAKLRTLDTLADLEHQLALDEEAVALNRKRLTLAKQLYGPNDPRVVKVLVDLSVALMASQESAERESVLKEALAILDRNGDTDSQLRGTLLGEFAQWAFAYDSKKALQYAQASVKILRRYPPSSDLIEALIMEGVTLMPNGEGARAEAVLTESAKMAIALDGKRADKLIRIYAYRSEARYFQGNWSGAQEDLHEAYHVARDIGGEEDSQTIQIEQRLALLLMRTSRIKEALRYGSRARDVMVKQSPADDSWFLPMALEISGLIQGEAGNLEAGLQDLQQATQSWMKYHGGSADAIPSMERYANLLIVAGHLPEADQLLTESATIRAKIDNYSTNQNGDLIGRVSWLIAAGQAAEAQPLMKRFQVQATPGNAVSLTGVQRAILQARIDLALGKTAAAATGMQALRSMFEQSHLRTYLQVYEAAADLLEGKAKLIEGQPAAALPLLQNAQRLHEALYDEHSLLTADVKVALAECLIRLSRRTEARTLLDQAVAIHASHREIGEHLRAPLRAALARLKAS